MYPGAGVILNMLRSIKSKAASEEDGSAGSIAEILRVITQVFEKKDEIFKEIKSRFDQQDNKRFKEFQEEAKQTGSVILSWKLTPIGSSSCRNVVSTTVRAVCCDTMPSLRIIKAKHCLTVNLYSLIREIHRASYMVTNLLPN